MKKQNKISLLLILLFTIFLVGCEKEDRGMTAKSSEYQSGKYTTWSLRLAHSEMERQGNSLMYGRSDPEARWRYTTGLFLKSLLDLWEVTGDSKYFEYAKNVIDSFVGEYGDIKTYKIKDYNLDKINTGKVLLKLYQITKDRRYKLSAELLREQLRKQPRTSGGGFWHKQRYPWQMWLDGIYMSSPFYAEFGLMFKQTDAFNDVLKQIQLIDGHTRDAKTGLRYHGWDESKKQAWADPVTGCSPHFWGRALGWYSMALVDVLDFVPMEYENRKQLLYMLTDLLQAIIRYQDDSGLWYQIVNLGDHSGNYLETSCSAMFVYTIAKAINKGYIDKSYGEIALKGYHGLINKMISTDENKRVHLNGICSVAGLGGDPYRDGSFEYYISEPVVANDLKGVGPFIMAGIQLDKIKSIASN